MLRTFSVCATLAALSLIASQQVSAGDERDLKGTYGFTLAESCVQQGDGPSFTPGMGFDDNLAIIDPFGAMTYGGASAGLIVFDGRGGVSFQQAAATNIFNAPLFLAAPPSSPPSQPGPIPLGFGFGPALPFTCTGTYTVNGGKLATIAVNVTCTASISPSNPGNLPPHNASFSPNVITGFSSTFNMTGYLPQNPSHLVLTDLGDTGVQPVTLFFNGGQGSSLNGNGGFNVIAQRVCTRSTTADFVSPSTTLNLEPQ
jgi:hypothetical protein